MIASIPVTVTFGGGIIAKHFNHKFVDYFVLEYLFLLQTAIILRCFFLVHTSVTQVKVELLEMAKGAEVEELQTKLLEISKMVQDASVGYLQVPLSLLLVLNMLNSAIQAIGLYTDYTSTIRLFVPFL